MDFFFKNWMQNIIIIIITIIIAIRDSLTRTLSWSK